MKGIRKSDPLIDRFHPCPVPVFCSHCQGTRNVMLASEIRNGDKLIYSYNCETCGRFIKSVEEKYKEIKYAKKKKRKTKRIQKSGKES